MKRYFCFALVCLHVLFSGCMSSKGGGAIPKPPSTEIKGTEIQGIVASFDGEPVADLRVVM